MPFPLCSQSGQDRAAAQYVAKDHKQALARDLDSPRVHSLNLRFRFRF
jgi:hypothetical protein